MSGQEVLKGSKTAADENLVNRIGERVLSTEDSFLLLLQEEGRCNFHLPQS